MGQRSPDSAQDGGETLICRSTPSGAVCQDIWYFRARNSVTLAESLVGVDARARREFRLKRRPESRQGTRRIP